MSKCVTKYFGELEYTPDAAFEFPAGLPGFESARRFFPVQSAGCEPLLFLQSAEHADLCFVAMPVQSVDSGYKLEMTEDDTRAIGWPEDRAVQFGPDLLCLALVTVHESGPTANLRAPVVVNLRNHRAVQAISPDTRYSHQHALSAAEPDPC
jgi:flagellar assembly factor FliW